MYFIVSLLAAKPVIMLLLKDLDERLFVAFQQ